MASIKIEYVLALPEMQSQEYQILSEGTILGAALPYFALDQKAKALIEAPVYGIFNQIVDLDYVLQAGDRIEVYRPLQIDPKTARKIRAERKKRLNSAK
ncbi:RnfH family protein [Wohlfahrtiimonas chitiniclastica]|uniref:RnfH family protein n=1 Tax=Wohlfahrtiimonas chitiniclastica TaxID=400946 RepID=UPI000B9988C0|nr:RnfH family protein [Wohlfahrtiimonas chitiniclastica]OYQ87038.1 RnfH family protein [Wohlfahrtiimonas chitiniclastica]